jgi:hypothetical protein
MSIFKVLETLDYNYDDFLEVATRKLANENIGPRLTKFINKTARYEVFSRNIRDLIKISRLTRN